MEWTESPLFAAAVGGLVGGAGFLAFAVCVAARAPDDPAARFAYGYLGMFGFALGLLGGLGLVHVAGPHVGTSAAAALAAVVAVNVVVQPVALLICWTAVQKLRLGLCGCVAYAWRQIPERELADVTPATHRMLARHCVRQGLIALPIGASISVSFAAPFLT